PTRTGSLPTSSSRSRVGASPRPRWMSRTTTPIRPHATTSGAARLYGNGGCGHTDAYSEKPSRTIAMIGMPTFTSKAVGTLVLRPNAQIAATTTRATIDATRMAMYGVFAVGCVRVTHSGARPCLPMPKKTRVDSASTPIAAENALTATIRSITDAAAPLTYFLVMVSSGVASPAHVDAWSTP